MTYGLGTGTEPAHDLTNAKLKLGEECLLVVSGTTRQQFLRRGFSKKKKVSQARWSQQDNRWPGSGRQ